MRLCCSVVALSCASRCVVDLVYMCVCVCICVCVCSVVFCCVCCVCLLCVCARACCVMFVVCVCCVWMYVCCVRCMSVCACCVDRVNTDADVVSLVAGVPDRLEYGEANATLILAAVSIAGDGNGSLLVVDEYNHCVVKVDMVTGETTNS